MAWKWESLQLTYKINFKQLFEIWLILQLQKLDLK